MIAPTVAVRLYRPIALALEARGVSSEDIFAEFGLPPPLRSGWELRVPLEQFIGLWERLIEVADDPSFALHAAEHVDLTTCDVITYLEGHAATVREAVENKLRYLPLITNAIAWTLELSGADAVLTLHEKPPRPPLAPVAEYLLAARHIFFARFGPPHWALRAVHFRHARHGAQAEQAEFVRIFGVEPAFEAGHDQLLFHADLLDAPMKQRDSALSELLSRYATQDLQKVPSATSWTDRVRQQLASGIDPGISEVARRLGVSTRALQRSLSKESVTYLELSNASRRVAAERLLVHGELSIAEVAYALNFGDVPAFHRAFVRWTGRTPGEFRSRALGSVYREPTLGRLIEASR